MLYVHRGGAREQCPPRLHASRIFCPPPTIGFFFLCTPLYVCILTILEKKKMKSAEIGGRGGRGEAEKVVESRESGGE